MKKVDPEYYARPVYYKGVHPQCQYQGAHVHDPKLGPITVTETDEREILKKYRYEGMEDSFKAQDDRW